MAGLRLEALLGDLVLEATTVEGERVFVKQMRLTELVTSSGRDVQVGKIRQQMFGWARHAAVDAIVLRVFRLVLEAVLHDRGVL